MEEFKKLALCVGLVVALAFVSVCLLIAYLYQVWVAYGLAAVGVLAAIRWMVLPVIKQSSEIVLSWQQPRGYMLIAPSDQGHYPMVIGPTGKVMLHSGNGQRAIETTIEEIDDKPATYALPSGGQSIANRQEALLASVLHAFQIHAAVVPEATQIGPRVIQLGIIPTTGANGRHTRIDEITRREKDIQLALRAKSIRIISPVPGENYVGIEIPNPKPTIVTIADVLESSEYQDACATSKLVFALGRDITGKVQVCDIEKAPHILIGGATNMGKSVLLNVLIACLLSNATPDDVRLLMVDPKQVELTQYNGVAHLLRPVITDMTQVVPMLKCAIDEMERRYRIFAELGVRKLSEYRQTRLHRPELENLPSWVIIFDEFADLMMTSPRETEDLVIRLAQKARATGIHLVIATQKPIVKVVTSLIKGNLPTAVALKTKSHVDSQVILDQSGAERLLGNGDMLYLPPDAEQPLRIQGAYITGEEIQSIIAEYQTDDGLLAGRAFTSDDEQLRTEPIQIAARRVRKKATIADAIEIWNAYEGNIGRPALHRELKARGLECSDYLANNLLEAIKRQSEAVVGGVDE